MKALRNILRLLPLLCLMGCATTRFAGTTYRNVYNEEERIAIARQQRPDLEKYFKDGLIYVQKMTETTTRDGVVTYRFDYSFQPRDVYDYSERMSLLKKNFPELYQLFQQGRISITNMYKYVDEKGTIRLHVDYKHL